MAKDLGVSLLLDFYGDMLTDKQRDVVKLYYNEDLSLAEIAEHSGITRQGVRDSIKRAEVQLREYEDCLGLARRFGDIAQGLERIDDLARRTEDFNLQHAADNEISRCMAEIRRIADALKRENQE